MAPLKVAVFDGVEIDVLRQTASSLPGTVPIEYVAVPGSFGKQQQPELREAMKGFGGAVVRSNTQFHGALDELPDLKFIGRAGIGVDSIDVSRASKNGVFVFYAPDSNSASVAEMVFGQLSELERKIGWQHAELARGANEKSVKKSALGAELYQKSTGIIGVGNIGAKVASVGLGYGMQVQLFDAIKPETEITALISTELRKRGLVVADESRVAVQRSLDGVLANSDYVTVHVPKLDNTMGLIGRDQLEKMRKNAVLINDSREGIVDEAAVKEALDAGRLRGYITDVLKENSPLHGHQKVLVTAHTGGNTKEAQVKAARMIGESIAEYVQSGGKAIRRSYNYPSMDASLTQAYDLTRIMGAFATQYIAGIGRTIKSMRVDASGLVSYDPMALKMAAAAGSALVQNRLNGRGDLPALGLLESDGIKVYAAELKGARPGIAPQISLTYGLDDGTSFLFSGQSEPTENGEKIYFLKTIGAFSGRGIRLMPTCYVLAEHQDIRGQIGHVGTAIGNHGMNIAQFELMQGNDGNNLIACSIGQPSDISGLLGKIQADTGLGSKALFINLATYKP
ncbi:TPA: hypothetical protein HA295_01255 [Candidatus Woesearchaeota archaeon]|nr:hypothetical protein [Candidatus Woesearchaeota archaeon]